MNWLRARPWWFWALGGVVVVLGAFAAGRFMAPTRVETVDTSSTFAAWDWRQATRETVTAGPTTTTTTTRRAPGRPAQAPVPGPAGEPICPECPAVDETTTVSQAGPVVTTRDTDQAAGGVQATEERHEKIVERSGPRVAVFGTVGVPFSAGGLAPLQYGVAVTAQVLGPVSVLAAGSGGPAGGQATVGVGVAF